jgi:hypothetical protein
MDILTRYLSLRPKNGSLCPQSCTACCLAPTYPLDWWIHLIIVILFGIFDDVVEVNACIQWIVKMCYYPQNEDLRAVG